MPKSRSASLTVELTGELTIRTVGDAHARLCEALLAGSPVLAHIAPDANVDLTFVQLIESARRSATEADVAFALAAPAAGALLEVLNRGGFVETAGQRAFWLEHSGEP